MKICGQTAEVFPEIVIQKKIIFGHLKCRCPKSH
jgi:hypothetical protein